MMTSVHLDNKPMGGTIEVYDVWANRMLPSELQPVQLSCPKDRPEMPLCIGLIRSQSAR